MTRTASPTDVPAICAHNREAVGGELQALLVDLVDLSLLGKQVHWSVVEHLRSLHLQFDNPVEEQLWMVRAQLPQGGV